MNTKQVVLSRILTAVVLALLLALPFAHPAQAGEVIPGNPNASVGPDEIINDDLFISGQLVTIDGAVNGNVFAAGQQVVVNGTVDGNLFTGAQSVIINGQVSGSLFAGAYALELGPEASIGGSSFFGGFAVTAKNGSQIDHTLYMGGYQADLQGDIGRDVIAGLGAIKLDGTVNGDVKLELGQSSDASASSPEDFTFYFPGSVEILEEGIEQTENSVIGGEFDYTISEYQVESPQFNSPEDIGNNLAGAFVANAVRARIGEFVALLIVGAAFFRFWPNRSAEVMQEYEENPFANMGWGLLVALLFPLLLVVMVMVIIFLAIAFGLISLGQLAGTIISLGGVGLSAVWVITGILFWMVSKTLFAYFLGEKLMERIGPESLDNRWAILIVLAIGLVIYEILRAIPLVGIVVAFLVILTGVGAIFQVARNAWRARQAA